MKKDLNALRDSCNRSVSTDRGNEQEETKRKMSFNLLMQEAVTLRNALEKALAADAHDEVLDILGAVEKLKVVDNLVSETKIGITVKSVTSKYAKGDAASKKAQAILKEWTRLAKEEKSKGSSNGGGGAKGKSKATPNTTPGGKTAVAAAPSLNVAKEVELLSEARLKIFHLFVETLSKGDKSLVKSVEETACRVEKALDAAFPSLGKEYVPRARTILINMKKNEKLRSAVASGALSPDELATKPIVELGNEEFLRKREEMRQEDFEAKRLDWDEANEAEIKLSLGIDPNAEVWHYDSDDESDAGIE